MTLVERLRTRPTGDPYLHAMVHEAADEIERLQAEVERLRKDAERYRWLRESAKEAPLRPRAYAAEFCPDTRLKYVFPDLVAWADYMGQVPLDDAIDALTKQS